MNTFDSISHHRAAFSTFEQNSGFDDSHGGTMDAPLFVPAGSTKRVDSNSHCEAFSTATRLDRRYL